LSDFFCLSQKWSYSIGSALSPILSIHEKVKTTFVRIPILIPAIPVRAVSLEVAKGAGRATKQDWRFDSGQPTKPVAVHNFHLTMGARLPHFAIALREG